MFVMRSNSEHAEVRGVQVARFSGSFFATRLLKVPSWVRRCALMFARGQVCDGERLCRTVFPAGFLDGIRAVLVEEECRA
jgi:hypothetical protein